MNEETTASRVRRLRLLLGYPLQQDFARALGIEPPRYRNVERGHPLSIGVALRIVTRHPGISLDWLYLGQTRNLSDLYRSKLTPPKRNGKA